MEAVATLARTSGNTTVTSKSASAKNFVASRAALQDQGMPILFVTLATNLVTNQPTAHKIVLEEPRLDLGGHVFRWRAMTLSCDGFGRVCATCDECDYPCTLLCVNMTTTSACGCDPGCGCISNSTFCSIDSILQINTSANPMNVSWEISIPACAPSPGHHVQFDVAKMSSHRRLRSQFPE